VESASGACAVMLGKPGHHIARYALALLGAEPQNTIVVGDLQETDIRFANNNGMRGALMLTGLTGREDISSQDLPAFVFESLSDLVAYDRDNFL
jgi:ribonucleotide monophosphatase NagD (HAD superfamily)